MQTARLPEAKCRQVLWGSEGTGKGRSFKYKAFWG